MNKFGPEFAEKMRITPTEGQFQDMAAEHGLPPLTSERLIALNGIYSNLYIGALGDEGRLYNDAYAGLMIREPESEEDGVSYSRTHFTPSVDGQFVLTPQPQERTRIMHEGVQSLQHYTMLTENGYFSAPDFLRAEPEASNTAMFSVAKRVGFVATKGSLVIAYPELRDWSVSPEALRLENMLSKRV